MRYCYTILLGITLLFPLAAFSEELAEAVSRVVPESRAEVMASFSPVVKKVSPAVVNIYTKKKVRVQTQSPFFSDPFFKQFLGEEFQGGAIRERIESSLGSGVIVKPTGLIITNNHVVKDGDEITVSLADKREFSAQVVLADPRADLALLKVNPKGESLPYLQLYDSDRLEVGDLVLAIGNPFGVGQTVTSGIVSALARTKVGIGDYQFFIQTDAAINPGNSGGALVNMDGRLVGVNTAIYSSSGGSNGIGFAIPSAMVATIIDNAENAKAHNGHIVRPWLGAAMQTVTSEIASSLSLKIPSGVLISNIYPESPADKAGLKVGDVITQVDGHPVEDEQALRFRIATYPIGKEAQFKVLRHGEEARATVTMAPPIEKPARDMRLLKGEQPFSGAVVANLSPALADELDMAITQGVVVLEVKNGAIAANIGLARGDIIRSINNIAVTSTDQLEKVIRNQPRGWRLAIQRDTRVIQLLVR